MPSVYMVPEGDSVTVTLATNIPYSFGFKVTVEGNNRTATRKDTRHKRNCSAGMLTSHSGPTQLVMTMTVVQRKSASQPLSLHPALPTPPSRHALTMCLKERRSSLWS